jgi:hypothetical protein
MAGAACAPRLPDPVPVAEPGELAQRLRAIGTPGQSQLIEFKWRYRGREGRFSGEGALRVNPPDSVRLDLLGPGWSGVQSAVLLGGEVYYIGEQRIELPPPGFIWTMLGVFRPPAGVEPRAYRRGDVWQLVYRLSERRFLAFTFDADGALIGSELEEGGHVVQSIRLEPGDPGRGPRAYRWPKEARYRDLGEFHEVRIRVVEVREHAPFESRIFRAAAR